MTQVACGCDAMEHVEKTATPRSLLDVLKAPQPSELTRKRKVASNPPIGQKAARGQGSSEPKSVTAKDRLREFPGECLSVKIGGKLFCEACREELSLRKNIIKNHITCKKHNTSKEKLSKSKTKQKDIAESLRIYDNEHHLVGETLPMEQRVYRLKVLKTFLRAAVPLAKLDMFRDLLEENAYRLTDRSHLTDLIPFLMSQEQADVKAEIGDRPVSVIFDGTTRLGEAMAVVVRFVDDSFAIQQRLVRLQLLVKSMTGEEIARELINVISAQYGISSNNLVAAMHDRAACNGVALRTIQIVYASIVDIGCFSHTLDLVGSKFVTPCLSSFMVWWLSLFSHSPKAMLLWKEKTGIAYQGYSATRWWSKYEVMKQLMDLFGDVEPFLKDVSVSPVTVEKLLSVLRSPNDKKLLQVELAATVDAGMPFVKATYNLEGDGPLVLTCYDTISALNVAARQAYYPNLESVAAHIAASPREESDLLQHANTCIQPGIAYYFQQVSTNMKASLEAFKAARLFSPFRLTELNPSITTIDSLTSFPFLRSEIPALKQELPLYQAAAQDINPSYDPLIFWKNHESDLPTWAKAARQVFLVQPSSAASERVFSLLRNSFGERQNSALQDYIETSLMLQYNNH